VTEFEAKNLAAIRRALDHHNKTCPVPASAILLNPVDHALLEWTELWGIPVLADERVPVKRVRIACDGSAWTAEEELEQLIRPRTADPTAQVETPKSARFWPALLAERRGAAIRV
jgi:hypothetical protein